MSVKSLFIYALSLTMGIGAVTHAKSQLIKHAPLHNIENKELASFTPRYIYDFHRSRRHRMRPHFSYAPGHWSHWTA